MFCIKCGNQIQENAKFCVKCGCQVSESASAMNNVVSNSQTTKANKENKDMASMGTVKHALGAFFSKNSVDKVDISTSLKQDNYQSVPNQIKNVSSDIQESVMIYLAERYSVGERNYPNYLRDKYDIGFPNELLSRLEKEGYIRQSLAKESLSHLKVADLKGIATRYGLSSSRKKEELCSMIIDNVSEDELSACFSERYWILTDKGRAKLENNKHVIFYLDKHPYSLENIGIDISTYANLFVGSHTGGIRDVIWGELNKRSVTCYKEAVANRNFHEYCQIIRTMALFLYEEERFRDALSMYIRYMNYKVNFDSAIKAMSNYSFSKNINDAANSFYIFAETLPFEADEIISISEGCGFDSEKIREFIENAIKEEKDTGVLTAKELAEFIMYGLNGNHEAQKQMSKLALQSACKKIR